MTSSNGNIFCVREESGISKTAYFVSYFVIPKCLILYLLQNSCKQKKGRHQMKTFSALLAFCARNSPVTGEFPTQRPVTRNFDVFFDLRQNRQLSKPWRRWWFESLPQSLWRHCNAKKMTAIYQDCTVSRSSIKQHKIQRGTWKGHMHGLSRALECLLWVHDDVIKWKHFPRNWPFVRGIHRSPVNSPHKSQRR